MHDTMVGLLEKADLAIASCAGVIEEDDLEPMARSVRDAKIRISYPEDISVVALVGGTGSGKSSLANAVCGADVAMI
ncbi:MAG: ABC transporter, partial [Actinobacteria bacterium]|nr:ABC transporter [Actinomycetota bacterium]